MIKAITVLCLTLIGAGFVAPARAMSLPGVAPVTACENLRFFDPALPDVPMQVSAAEDVAQGGGMVCRVRGLIAPQIRFEARLPEHGWTQRYLQTGCGGLCGRLAIEAPQQPCPALEQDALAMASTDMGHDTQGGTFGASDAQLRVDFAYRGVHLTALVVKALIQRFYGQAPRWSYFSGCSDGGREALMEAQRYPTDFDGIAAGAPALNFLVQNSFYHAWNAHAVMPAPAGPRRLTAADLPILHAGALAACDAADGLTDGLIADPLACRFDPAALACTDGKTGGCLSADAIAAAREIYAGAHDAAGRKLVVGGPMPGSELSWQGVIVPGAGGGPPFGAIAAADVLRFLAFPKPLPATWRLDDFAFTGATMTALGAMHGLYDATDPDLGGFSARHGKLLMWHGWSDPHISPTNSIAYVQAFTDRMGRDAADAMLRLFVVPGLYHCEGGEGFTSIDVLTPLMAWTEDGIAPDRIVASRDAAAARLGQGRPVFAWPAMARLRSGADPDRPESWERRDTAAMRPKLYADWLGAGFFAPGYERDCGFDGEQFLCQPLPPDRP